MCGGPWSGVKLDLPDDITRIAFALPPVFPADGIKYKPQIVYYAKDEHLCTKRTDVFVPVKP